MKISTLLFFALLISGKAFTQLSKGQFLLGGSLRFESVKESYYPSGSYEGTNIFVSPAVGVFVLNKLAGGVRVDFSSYKSNSSNVETKQTITELSPFMRYYFLPVASKINVFLDAGYLFSKTKWNSFSNPAFTDKSRGYQVLAGPSIFLTEQIALEFTIGYRHTTSDRGAGLDATKSSTLSSGLGLQIHFGKKKQHTSQGRRR
ncbi:MAG: porin family protein [Sphingobacteriales bacterium]|nr:MAG: porin family protein [Sphingobacteriales bacterium]